MILRSRGAVAHPLTDDASTVTSSALRMIIFGSLRRLTQSLGTGDAFDIVVPSRLLKNVFRGVKQPLRFLFVPVRIRASSVDDHTKSDFFQQPASTGILWEEESL
jgi:hypothetical protein